MKLFSDQPILNRQEDTLNRSKFADLVTNYILSDATSDGFVMSINGEWGCGKTSIINLIKENIKQTPFDSKINRFPIIVDYSPWNATSQDRIIEQFLNTIRNSFSTKKVMEKIKKALNIVKGIVGVIPALSSIKPVVKTIDYAFSEYADSLIGPATDLEDLKEKVINGLKSSCVRYIVFIDDIDRLNDEEVKLLIQLVKSICDFPNVTYVLSYDKTIVAGALNNAQADVNGNKYLEKIVQMEFNVPSIKRSTIQDIVVDDLLKVINGCNSKDLDSLKSFISYGLFSQLHNLREEKRYINSLLFALECHKDEIDIGDLCAITYLRIVDEKIFELILKYRDYILDRPSSDGDLLKQIEADFNKELKETRFDIKYNKYLLSHLFPNMFTVSSILPQQRDDIKRLYHRKKFNRYLQMELDDNDISAERLSGVLKLDSPDALLSLANSLSEKQQETFFKLITDLSYDLEEDTKFRTLLVFIFNCLNSLDYKSWNYEVLKEHRIKVIVTNMIQNIGQDMSETILKDVVAQSKDYNSLIGLYYLITDETSSRYNSVLCSFSNGFKTSLFCKAKDVILTSLKDRTDAFKCESRGLLRFLVENCKNELVEIIKTKDNVWVACFLAESIYLGFRSYGSKTDYCYYYDEELLSILSTNLNLNFKDLRKCSFNKKTIQRLIAIEMQIKNMPFSEKDKSYFCDDIEKYCKENGIDFVPSNMYEVEQA